MSKSLIWPHETPPPSLRKILINLLFSNHTRLLKILNLARKFLTNAINAYILKRKDPFPNIHEEVMTFLNGEKSASLANKYDFIETLAKMKKGYLIPHQILVTPNNKETSKILSTISSWKTTKIYCKPLTGDNARGIKVVSPNELPKILNSIKEDYILQQSLPFTKEFRWAISRGKDGILKRFCFKKVRPTIKGNGKKTLIWLILTDKNMTIRSKLVNLARQYKKLLKVIPQNEEYLVTPSANPPMGSYEQVVTDEKTIKHLDIFMLNLIHDLEEYLDLKPLPLICFDVGIVGPEVLGKESIVPLECQMPFSALAYFMKYKHSITKFLDFYYSALP